MNRHLQFYYQNTLYVITSNIFFCSVKKCLCTENTVFYPLITREALSPTKVYMHVKIMSYVLTIKTVCPSSVPRNAFWWDTRCNRKHIKPSNQIARLQKEQKTTYHVAFSPCSDKRKIFLHKSKNMIIVQILYKTMSSNICWLWLFIMCTYAK